MEDQNEQSGAEARHEGVEQAPSENHDARHAEAGAEVSSEKVETAPEQPPADNDHVAEGAEKFPEEAPKEEVAA